MLRRQKVVPLNSCSLLPLPKLPSSISLAIGLATEGRCMSGTFNPSSFPSDSKKSPATNLFRAASAASALLFKLPGTDAVWIAACESNASSSSSSESSEKIAWKRSGMHVRLMIVHLHHLVLSSISHYHLKKHWDFLQLKDLLQDLHTDWQTLQDNSLKLKVSDDLLLQIKLKMNE